MLTWKVKRSHCICAPKSNKYEVIKFTSHVLWLDLQLPVLSALRYVTRTRKVKNPRKGIYGSDQTPWRLAPRKSSENSPLPQWLLVASSSLSHTLRASHKNELGQINSSHSLKAKEIFHLVPLNCSLFKDHSGPNAPPELMAHRLATSTGSAHSISGVQNSTE